jgi:hypothetical protein
MKFRVCLFYLLLAILNHLLVKIACRVLPTNKQHSTFFETNNEDQEQFYFDQLVKKELGSTFKLDKKGPSGKKYINNFDSQFKVRHNKLLRKKNIIIGKVFELNPLIGELLGIANMENSNQKSMKMFVRRETNLVKKYILMMDDKFNDVEEAAKTLINLILCGNDENNTNYLLNELLEGLCFNENESFKIFKEIVVSVIIDSLLKQKTMERKESQIRFSLLKLLNKDFHYKSFEKIRFIQLMLMMEMLKEKLMYIVYNNENNVNSNLF